MRVLVAYATAEGTTTGVAERIGAVLLRSGHDVDVLPVGDVTGVEDYDLLRKYWFSVSGAEQEKRFRRRLDDPMRRWKLSPVDVDSIARWEDCSRAEDEIFVHTDTAECPRYVVDSDDKRRARVNMITHLLSSLPYYEVEPPAFQLPARPASTGYHRTDRRLQTYVPDHAASLR